MKDKQFSSVAEAFENTKGRIKKEIGVEQKEMDPGLLSQIQLMQRKINTFLEDLDRFEGRHPEVLDSPDVSRVHGTLGVIDSALTAYLR